MKDAETYFKLVSILLEYPDERYVQALPELESAVQKLPPGRPRAGIEAFLADARTRSTLQLQESHTAAFDLNPSATLNMTYHLWGDSEKRAETLVRLQQVYGQAGYEISATELPDYLPLLLEFLAIFPAAKRSASILQCFQGLGAVVDRLRGIAPLYAQLLQPLVDICGEPDPDSPRRAGRDSQAHP